MTKFQLSRDVTVRFRDSYDVKAKAGTPLQYVEGGMGGYAIPVAACEVSPGVAALFKHDSAYYHVWAPSDAVEVDEPDRISLDEFIAANGIAMTAERAAANPNMDDMPHGSRHWICTLRRGDASLAVPFSQGPALREDPTAADILDCLASDAAGVENARGFDDWAGEYGYDTDSRKAERIFQTCQEQAAELKRFLGDEAYERLLWHTEKL